MILRGAICIPVYNNPGTVAEVIEGCLRATALPILVIDDGSLTPVESFGPKHDRVSYHRLSKNRGKGVAIQQGFKIALKRGFTHLFCIDADGQHQSSDLRFLIQACEQNPWSIIIGQREMSDAPGVSKFGCSFSNFWLWYQTGTRLQDSQSGLRVYPLYRVQGFQFSGSRFEFELEILIRSLWSGVTIVEFPVEAEYAENRVSHFRKFRDNLRITIFNTIVVVWSLLSRNLGPKALACGALAGILVGTYSESIGLAFALVCALSFLMRTNGVWLGVHALFTHLVSTPLNGDQTTALTFLYTGLILVCSLRLQSKKKVSWTGTIRGGRVGNAILMRLLAKAGLRSAYFCLGPIVPYFYLFAPKARRSSDSYLRAIDPGLGFFSRQRKIFGHFYRFGTLLLDRMYQSCHDDFKFEYETDGFPYVRKLLSSERGGVILGAHVGALDIASRSIADESFGLNMVRSEYEARDGLTIGQVLGDKAKANSVVIDQNQQSMIYFKQLLESGVSVCILPDRPMSPQIELIPFLGRLIVLDGTAFKLAATLKATMLTCYGFKRGFNRYGFQSNPPQDLCFKRGYSRDLQVYEWLCEYAKDLEDKIRRFPDQWNNFYDVFGDLPKTPLRDLSKEIRVTSYEDLLARNSADATGATTASTSRTTETVIPKGDRHL